MPQPCDGLPISVVGAIVGGISKHIFSIKKRPRSSVQLKDKCVAPKPCYISVDKCFFLLSNAFIVLSSLLRDSFSSMLLLIENSKASICVLWVKQQGGSAKFCEFLCIDRFRLLQKRNMPLRDFTTADSSLKNVL